MTAPRPHPRNPCETLELPAPDEAGGQRTSAGAVVALLQPIKRPRNAPPSARTHYRHTTPSPTLAPSPQKRVSRGDPAHIIEISPLDRGILWGVMGLIFIIYYHFPELSMLIFFGFELALGALSWIVLDKLTRIRAALVPSVAPGGGGSYKPPECCPASGRRAPPPHLLAQKYKYWLIY